MARKKKANLQVPNQRFMDNKPFGGLFKWQLDWLRAKDEGKAKFSILEIHRRGRKSSTSLNFQIRECYRLPNTRHNIIAPSFEQARRIYWDDPTMLRAALPGEQNVDYRLNEQRMIVKFPKVGSVLQFYGGDDPDNLRGIDGESFTFDEWSQHKLGCWTEIVQPIIEQYPDRCVTFIYTPAGQNHATDMLDHACYVDEGATLPTQGKAERMRPDWYAARLAAFSYGPNEELIPESGIFDIAALERIRQSPETTIELFEQEYGCARIAQESMALITSAMLNRLPRNIEVPATAPRLVSCDPSMGGDACVIKAFEGSHVAETLTLHIRDTMRIVGEMALVGSKHGATAFVVDSIGIGRGICDRLREMGKRVIEFSSGESAGDNLRFVNKRAELWFQVRKLVESTAIEYPQSHEVVKEVPFASRYQVNSTGKIQIVGKDKIKKDLGHSPDHAEAWAMGLWGQQFVEATPGGPRVIKLTSQSGNQTDWLGRNRFKNRSTRPRAPRPRRRMG